MSLDELYQRVTAAILDAEAAETTGSSIDVARAYLTVSFVEEEIAELLGAGEEEGAVARRGAVRAALTAGLLWLSPSDSQGARFSWTAPSSSGRSRAPGLRSGVSDCGM